MKIKECILIEPFICKNDESLVEVAKKLREINIRHIFVVNHDCYPLGIISMTDMNNRVVAKGIDPKTLTAADIMTKPIDLINIEDDVMTTAKEMMNKGRVMNAVVQDDKMVGIITINQLMEKGALK
ncbi:CBS domain-containing protein [Candidatus Woesearchaeota archaeon]|nr:CBS domain-containing protein [Candidatus Woesearchaeota archaeon]